MNKKLISLIVLPVVAGLINSPKSDADAKHLMQSLSPVLLQQLPQRVSHLKPGMTRDQIWKTLALPTYCQHLGGYGSGPSQEFADVHQIGHYTLCLIFDEPRLKSYSLTSNPLMWNGHMYKSAKEVNQAERGLVRTE